MDRLVVCYLNKYTIKSIYSTDSIHERYLNIAPVCGLARGNQQSPSVLDLFCKS